MTSSSPTLSIETEIEGTKEQDEYGIVIRQPMSQARKSISKAMSIAWKTIPHVTDCNDADITEIEALRRNFTDPDQPNLKLTLLPFILKAVCRALKKNPILNATIDTETGDVLFRTYINIAIGVQSDRGLIAPVLRNIDSMSIGEISEQLDQITVNARSASFEIADTRGATYTVSNAGAVGRTRYSTPIIQQNTVACLAVGRAQLMPWVIDDQIVPRLILPLSHSIDHRLVDGGREIPFIEHLINDLEHPMRFAV
jgi:pyruvate dehydrogenase E2 component (dihydrolipoamide acetyltransferase)